MLIKYVLIELLFHKYSQIGIALFITDIHNFLTFQPQ